MKKTFVMAALLLGALSTFGQSAETRKQQLNDTKTIESAAKADASLVDKKAMTADDKKKKPRREKSRKECSRMKS